MTLPITTAESSASTPRCVHFTQCGGCQSQHIPYEQELENKRARLAYLLQNSYQGDIPVHSAQEYHYRNRMDFLVTNQGLAVRGTRGGTLALSMCPIADERLEAMITPVNEWLRAGLHDGTLAAFDPRKRSGVLKYCTMRVARERTIVFMLNEDDARFGAHTDAIKSFAHASDIEHVVIARTSATVDESLSLDVFAVKGDVYLVEDVLGVPLTYHAAGFFQNNPRVAERMVAYVRDALIAFGCADRTVVDAYGGVGTFAFALAPHCKEVVSVESYPLAADCIARTKAACGATNVVAHTLDAAKMEKLHLPQTAFYIVDPPRSGMDSRVLRYLLQARPEIVVYISCNPAQLAKELVQLGKTFTVERAALFDLFPQTNHSEAVVVLKRRH
jgi:23S rRNA (uracil-5-)-methyltransferase RumA